MSKEYKFDEEELLALIEEVVKEDLSSLSKSEEDKEKKGLEKADIKPEEDEDPAAGPEKEAVDSAPPASAADPIDASAMDKPDAPSPEQSAEDIAPHEEPDGDELAAAPEGDPAMQHTDGEGLKAQYGMLSDDDLDAHIEAAMAVCEARHGALATEPEMSPEMGGAPAPADPMADPMEAQMPVDPMLEQRPVMKSLTDSKVAELTAELEKVKVESDDKLKALMALVEHATAPMRKSVQYLSDLEHVKRPGESSEEKVHLSLSKAQITEKLKAKASDPSLAKSDRALINGYYSDVVTVEKLEHLLK
jgi:hypothetical protein